MNRIIALALLAALSVCANAEVSPQQVAEWLKGHDYLGKYDDARSSIYRLLKAAPSAEPMRAAHELASRWQIPEDIAAKVIEALVLERDDEEAAARLYRAAVKAAPESPDVWAMGVNFWADQGACGDAKLRDDYLNKPFAATRFLALGECEDWLPTYVRRYPDILSGRFQLVEYLAGRDPAAGLAASRWLLDGVAAARRKSVWRSAARRAAPGLAVVWQVRSRRTTAGRRRKISSARRCVARARCPARHRRRRGRRFVQSKAIRR